MYDVFIRGGEVVDGSGSPRGDRGRRDRRRPHRRDRQGRRARVAGRSTPSGRVVAPGFIDVHTHLDVQGFWDPTLSPSPLHGVTTVLGGNCGFTVAPLSADSGEYLMRMLARVEGMPLECTGAGVPWDWRTTASISTGSTAGWRSTRPSWWALRLAARRHGRGGDRTRRAPKTNSLRCRPLARGPGGGRSRLFIDLGDDAQRRRRAAGAVTACRRRRDRRAGRRLPRVPGDLAGVPSRGRWSLRRRASAS